VRLRGVARLLGGAGLTDKAAEAVGGDL